MSEDCEDILVISLWKITIKFILTFVVILLSTKIILLRRFVFALINSNNFDNAIIYHRVFVYVILVQPTAFKNMNIKRKMAALPFS